MFFFSRRKAASRFLPVSWGWRSVKGTSNEAEVGGDGGQGDGGRRGRRGEGDDAIIGDVWERYK